MKYISWIALTISIIILCFVLIQNKQQTDQRFQAIQDQINNLDHTHIEINLMMHEIKELQTSIEELKNADKEHTMLITQIDEKYLNYQWQLSTMEDRIVEIQRRLSP